MLTRHLIANRLRTHRPSDRRLVVLLGLLMGVQALRPGPALAQQTGNFCIEDGPGGIGSCTANDGGISRFQIDSITNGCVNTTGDTGTAVFEIDITTSPPRRYDYGIFVDLSGSLTGALDGDNCYHDFLPNPVNGATPPGPPYLNIVGDNDQCGDIDSSQTWTRTTQSITFTCRDKDADGQYDVHVCIAYDNNQGTTCNGVGDAYPGTGSKCQCLDYEIIGPLAVEMKGLRAMADGGNGSKGWLAATMFGIVSLVAFSRRRRSPAELG